MKFTGIIASLAVASTATAAAIPKLDVVELQSTVTRLSGVLTTVESTVGSGIVKSDIAGLEGELSSIHDLLNGLVGGVVGAVNSNGLLQGVLDLAGGLVTTVVNVLGTNDQVPDFGILSETLVGRIQSGEIDPAGLQNVLTVIGGTG
ncbi:hypothetical protein BJY04DRAFT_181561, partial [Aspergillus karnatakaensis]|uniref:uncharacterized protein n=1 Tax=Aspergillus karnatakaensis TaxID=1810916 RepID=UPI003CCD23EC